FDERNKKFKIGISDRVYVSYLSLHASAMITMDWQATVYIADLDFKPGATLSFSGEYIVPGSVMLSKRFAEDDSILERFRFLSNGEYYIFERAYQGDGYWGLKPNLAVNWTPEPSTYGAIVSACVLGVGFWRRRKSRLKPA
ncbi:PEP-CTERM sorting domain-containing protein, partial [Cephaloticoccus capnophilus]|uniref:PEP-CTERM sorting domain-containing protein n=1 Tax=Cephaloticoccus capnophilus TaxID=1548208 RepID=UPI0018D2B5F7